MVTRNMSIICQRKHALKKTLTRYREHRKAKHLVLSGSQFSQLLLGKIMFWPPTSKKLFTHHFYFENISLQKLCMQIYKCVILIKLLFNQELKEQTDYCNNPFAPQLQIGSSDNSMIKLACNNTTLYCQKRRWHSKIGASFSCTSPYLHLLLPNLKLQLEEHTKLQTFRVLGSNNAFTEYYIL